MCESSKGGDALQVRTILVDEQTRISRSKARYMERKWYQIRMVSRTPCQMKTYISRLLNVTRHVVVCVAAGVLA